MKRTLLWIMVATAPGLVACGADRGEDPAPREISMSQVATLGEPGADFSPHFATQIALWTPAGDTAFVLSQTYEDGYVHVYDPDGRIIRRIGGAGEGPGELGGMDPMVVGAAGDRLLVGSQFAPRLTTFTPDGADPVIEAYQGGTFGIQGLRDGRALLLPGATGKGPVFYSSDGSFEALQVPDSLRPEERGGYVVGPASSALAWLAVSRGGTFATIDSDGVVAPRFSIPIEPEEFDALPGIIAVAEEDGLLWVAMTIRRAELAPGTPFSLQVLDSVFDTRIAVLDPIDGAQVAQFDDPRALQRVSTESGLLLSHPWETEFGDTRIDVIRPELRTGNAR